MICISGKIIFYCLVQIKELSNVKEEVYGALDTYVAWELEFPIITVKKVLKTLEYEKEWKRIIQVFEKKKIISL
jgi:CO dehydrogenase/acetyl-CoA synthase alpha subunit